MNPTRRTLLSRCAGGPVSILDLSPRQLQSAAFLRAEGYLSLKVTLNAARLTITRLGRAWIAHEDGPHTTVSQAHEQMEREIARLKLREALDIKHRLGQPKHEQRGEG